MKIRTYGKILFLIDESPDHPEIVEFIEQALLEEEISISPVVDSSKLNIIFVEKSKQKKFKSIKNKIIIEIEELKGRSYAEIHELVKSILIADLWNSLQLILVDSEKKLEFIRNKKLYTDQELIKRMSHEIAVLTEIELLLLREEDVEKWNIIIKNFCKKNHLFSLVTICKETELTHEDGLLDSHTLIFQLPIVQYYLIVKDKNISKVEDEFKLEMLILVILRSTQNVFHLESRDIGEVEFWKKVFSKIPYPMAVISKMGELLIYNEHYASAGILPKECLSYKDNDHLEIRQKYYKIKRFDFLFHETLVHYYIFYSSEKIMNNPNNDLGIVSSSIAHELNNPLAGILAALSLLKIENDWSEEAILEIEEMKNGARRCKELVEIFLGFSRLSPKNSGVSSLEVSLGQALNLLRFRMVESDLRLDMKLSNLKDNLNFDVNISVLSMILYLILSELMTAFAHHRLLSPKSLSLLHGQVFGGINNVKFILNEEFDFEKNILDSKLLQYLLVFEKMEIVFFKNEIQLLKKL
jgi:hypothetical protein